VFGDYDCDGITSAAILTGILRALGGEVVPLLATRLEQHRALELAGIDRHFESRSRIGVIYLFPLRRIQEDEIGRKDA